MSKLTMSKMLDATTNYAIAQFGYTFLAARLKTELDISYASQIAIRDAIQEHHEEEWRAGIL